MGFVQRHQNEPMSAIAENRRRLRCPKADLPSEREKPEGDLGAALRSVMRLSFLSEATPPGTR